MKIYSERNRRIKIIFITILFLGFFVFAKNVEASAAHPFLIVKDSEYAALRARAAQAPWSQIKANAISEANSLQYSTTASLQNKSSAMIKITSSASLAYILDPANKATYLAKLKSTLGYWSDLYSGWTGSQNWDWTSPTASALFSSALALDIIYDDLTASERQSIESKIEPFVLWLKNEAASGWEPANSGGLGAWFLYKGNETEAVYYQNRYKTMLLAQLTNDGIFPGGSVYALDRFGDDESGKRHAKTFFMDVLEYTGRDKSFYTNSKLKGFYEFLFGYTYNPAGKKIVFGDTSPHYTPQFPNFLHRTASANRFSSLAAGYASYSNKTTSLPGRLLVYLLMDQPLAVPQTPNSRIFPDGGAFFVEKNRTNSSLMGNLWNWKTAAPNHTKYEINGIYLSGYGEHLMINSGYIIGMPDTVLLASSRSQNTVLINDTDHTSKKGLGITEGLTSENFDYASGDSGTALPNGQHKRNLLFVHPQDGREGYFTIIDEVHANTAGQSADVYFNVDSSLTPTTVQSQTEYSFKIGSRKFTSDDVNLDVFLGTPPSSATLGTRLTGNPGDHYYADQIRSRYTTDGSGDRRIVTVLFPYTPAHPKASMSRVSGTGYTGAQVNLGSSYVDTILESAGTSIVSYGGASFSGRATLYRKGPNGIVFYFVRQGKSFSDGLSARTGFDSVSNISLHLRNGIGKTYAAAATRVSFYYPNISSVLVDGVKAAPVSSASGRIDINLASGSHNIQLVGGGTTPVDTTAPAIPTGLIIN